MRGRDLVMFDADKAKQNAKKISWELDKLDSGHKTLLNRDYHSFWAHVKEINELFKSLKPLDREEREKLWNRMNTICESWKGHQQREINNRNSKSGNHKSWIIKQAESCRPLETIIPFLSSNVAEVKDMGRRLRETGQYLSKYKLEMTHEDKSECFERIKEVQLAQDIWWDGYKSRTGQDRERKQGDFRDRVRANIDKNKERYAHSAEALRKMNASADDLRDKISSAYNDGWRDKAYGWLSELENKISNTEDHLKRLEEWIREDEDKL